MPSMTPYAIIGPGDSDKLPRAMPPTALASAQQTSAVGSAGGMRRSSSDVAIAGSTDSNSSDETVSLPLISSPHPRGAITMQDDQYCYRRG
jgi:hypothetical protein